MIIVYSAEFRLKKGSFTRSIKVDITSFQHDILFVHPPKEAKSNIRTKTWGVMIHDLHVTFMALKQWRILSQVCVVMLFLCKIHSTDQNAIYLLNSVMHNNSTNSDECLERAILQSHSEHILLMCGSNATYCPTTVLNKNSAMSWMFFNRKVSVGLLDKRDFCIIAGDNVSHIHHLMASNQFRLKEKIMIVFPSAVSGVSPDLKTIFVAA